MKNLLKYALAIGVGFGLLYWVFKDINLLTTLQNFKNANYYWVLAAAFCGLLAHISRGYRWKLMLQPMGYNPSTLNVSLAVLIGYFTNLILPRAGELARSGALQKSENIPFEKSFGAVIAERLIDVFVALLLVFLNLLFEIDRIKGLVEEMLGEKFKNSNALILILIGAIIAAGLAIWLILKSKNKLQQNKIIKKLFDVFAGLWSGFSSVLKMKNPALFIFHTFFIWLMYYLGTYLLCLSVPIGQLLSPLAVFTILVMGSIGMAAPTMGGIGSYHFLVGKIVTLYGLNAEEGVNLATFLHTMQGIVFVMIFGAIAFLGSFFINNKNKKVAN